MTYNYVCIYAVDHKWVDFSDTCYKIQTIYSHKIKAINWFIITGYWSWSAASYVQRKAVSYVMVAINCLHEICYCWWSCRQGPMLISELAGSSGCFIQVTHQESSNIPKDLWYVVHHIKELWSHLNHSNCLWSEMWKSYIIKHSSSDNV